jgi:hypothetical protein
MYSQTQLTAGDGSKLNVEIWKAVAGSTATYNSFTATFSGAPTSARFELWHFSGENTTTPLDLNVLLPATDTSTSSTNPNLTVTTTSTAGIMVEVDGNIQNTDAGVGTGWTNLISSFQANPLVSLRAVRKAYSSAESSTTETPHTTATADHIRVLFAVSVSNTTPTTTTTMAFTLPALTMAVTAQSTSATVAMTLPALVMSLTASAEKSDIAMTLPALTMALVVGGSSLDVEAIAMTLPALVMQSIASVQSQNTQHDAQPFVFDAGAMFYWGWGM